ncbi:MAG: chromosome segregation ATPase [Sphingomonadales bacterium 32-68-7]|nr:MAG: chromosome segregation ATPase [Sphingomonadales bacterium 12-68-11]OYX10426.1 MAG: chromosome segregation ATPase [Sphingomonadales bacterium 32-68-7]
MHTSLAAQLAQLELGHLAIERPANALLDPPESEAVNHTLAAVWSDLFALFPDTALEDDAEELAWGMVNLFHRAAAKRGAQLDRATDEIRCLLASADGSEVHAVELETQIARARAAETAMIGLEACREAAALLYVNETGSSWRPAGGSRLNHARTLTSAVIDGRDFLRARAESRRRAALPEGTPVVFAGGRLAFPSAEDAKTFASCVWDTLDKVRERVADLVLVHGGDGKGTDRLAASWAERRKVPQVAFGLDTRLGARAGFKRNEQMLALKPRYLVAFAGNGVLERLVIQAKEQGIAVVDRRGPLGSHPKHAARLASPG